jgi:N-acetyl-alpha-D-glucosaminyl L-malate synthase BshA
MVDVIVNNQIRSVACALCHSARFRGLHDKKILETQGKSIPVITTLHGTDITLVGRDKTFAPVVSFSINQSDAITAVSYNLREETNKIFRIEKEIEVIQNFVDVRRFTKKPIDAFRKVIAPNNEKIIIHASNFRRIKRVEDVVRIFAKLHSSVPSKLLFVGDGPERPTAESLSRDLNIGDDIRFVGKQEQMEEILAIGDLFLLTSEYESFGLAALEAMAGRCAGDFNQCRRIAGNKYSWSYRLHERHRGY